MIRNYHYCGLCINLSLLGWLIVTPFLSDAQKMLPHQRKSMEVTWSNDFLNQTDRYFSNGFDIVLYHPYINRLPTRSLLLPDWGAPEVYHGLTLVHHFFTPDQLFDTAVVVKDRPYASYLLFGHRKTGLYPENRLKLTSEIRIGILGRYSGGETIQNGIHELLPASRTAMGWGNQVNSDLALDYRFKVEKGFVSTRNIEIIPYLGARAGIPYTDLDGGVLFRFGKLFSYFNTIGILNRRDLTVFLFADVSGKYVVYNATLQGGLFNSSPHTLDQVINWLAEGNVGISFGFKGFAFDFGQHFLSPEFPGASPHKWGSLTFRFSL